MKTDFLLITLLTIVSISCKNENISKNFDYGRVENNKYINNYFDFEITMPNEWIVQSKEQLEDILKTGKELVAGDDSKMKAVVKASEVNTANLIAVYQYQDGAAVEYNPSMMIMVESIKKSPGILTGGDYLFHTRRLLTQSQFKYDYIDEQFAKEVIDKKDFYKMNAEVKYMGINIKQIYYTTILKEFSFSIIISYNNDNQKDELLNSVRSMKFGN